MQREQRMQRWVMDWSAVRHVDAEAASQLTALMQQWAGQKVEMRWLGGDQLLGALNEEGIAQPASAVDAYSVLPFAAGFHYWVVAVYQTIFRYF